jgi:Leucine-rich repeat (LRR) protein
MYPFASGVTITDRYDYSNYAEIAAMPCLKSAQLQANCHVAEMFAFIRAATQLTSLHIADYPERQLKRLNTCTQLTKLTLSQLVCPDDFTGISAITGLKSLELSVCPRYADICRHVTPNLHTLRLVGHSVVSLDRLSLPNLHILRLNRCRVYDISPIRKMPALIELDIRCCPNLLDLTPINGSSVRIFTLILTPYQPLVNIRVLNMQLTGESNIPERIYKFQIEQINT